MIIGPGPSTARAGRPVWSRPRAGARGPWPGTVAAHAALVRVKISGATTETQHGSPGMSELRKAPG
eukprot:767973-Hanusia_phi.AAC.1